MFATSLQEANVDPLIRQELMGHSTRLRNTGGLGMTTVYIHLKLRTIISSFAFHAICLLYRFLYLSVQGTNPS
jgi:hypothetical protein